MHISFFLKFFSLRKKKIEVFFLFTQIQIQTQPRQTFVLIIIKLPFFFLSFEKFTVLIHLVVVFFFYLQKKKS